MTCRPTLAACRPITGQWLVVAEGSAFKIVVLSRTSHLRGPRRLLVTRSTAINERAKLRQGSAILTTAKPTASIGTFSHVVRQTVTGPRRAGAGSATRTAASTAGPKAGVRVAAAAADVIRTTAQLGPTPPKPIVPAGRPIVWASLHHEGASQSPDRLNWFQDRVNRIKQSICSHPGVPSEASTLAALRELAENEDLQSAMAQVRRQKAKSVGASALYKRLLTLDGSDVAESAAGRFDGLSQTARAQVVIEIVSEAAYKMVKSPSVFISPPILKVYTELQAHLGRPDTLAEVFLMFAHKPLPRLGPGGQVQCVKVNPRRVANAIDAGVVDVALDAAIDAENLDAAIAIIQSSVAMPAFRRAKLLKQGLVPMAGLAVTPLAAHAVASALSQFQHTMDPDTATKLAFIGLLAYFGLTGTLGVLAVTTANDQMRRVTWQSGTPIRERWMREEERAALDKVACAFGFAESYRYGDEEGVEFDALRQYILSKGMVLDATALLEGMS